MISARPTIVRAGGRAAEAVRSYQALFIMVLLLLVLGAFLVYPAVLMLANSFNVATHIFSDPWQWGLDHWRTAYQQPGWLLLPLWNTVMIFFLSTSVSFPLAVLISWVIARAKIPFSHGIEFMFWVAFMMPSIAVTIGWMLLTDPQIGVFNTWLKLLPFVDSAPLNIFSIGGIVWVNVMGNGIAGAVMLLVPAFRNMDAALEEAGRTSGASAGATMLRVTLPVMLPAMGLILGLKVVRVFQSFEVEELLGTRIDFFVYSTKVFDLVTRSNPPAYGLATALATATLVVVAFIIPFQRWVIHRRQYTTVTGSFRPGLVDLGRWRYVALGLILTILSLKIAAPFISLVLGSVMVWAGFFNIDPAYTLAHWENTLTNRLFLRAARNTFFLASTTAIISPIFFSMLAYILVRTRWPGRLALDSMIWVTAAIPGMLSGLGLLMMFLGTPGLAVLYGTIWALIIVVILQGNTTGVQLTKGVFVQMGADLEEQARISGAGWLRTYFTVWVPLLMPTLILLGTLNFIMAANTTSSIILLASRDTLTLSILALEFGTGGVASREQAGVVSLVIIAMSLTMGLIARTWGLRLGIRHRYS